MGVTMLRERTLRFRATPWQEDRLRAASALVGETMTQFALTPALRRADEVLGGGEVVMLPAEEYAAMLESLAGPPPQSDGLVALYQKPPLF